MVEVKSRKYLDPLLMELKGIALSKFNESFSRWGDIVLNNQGRLCVPDVDNLRSKILEDLMAPLFYSYGSHQNVL